jgi:hypothetical protein
MSLEKNVMAVYYFKLPIKIIILAVKQNYEFSGGKNSWTRCFTKTTPFLT